MTIQQVTKESKEKLAEFKNLKGRKMIVVDWDETLTSSKINGLTSSHAVELILNVVRSGLVTLIATGRCVTMEKIFIQEFVRQESIRKEHSLVIYIAGADGRSLVRFVDGKKEETLYEYRLSDEQLSATIKVLRELQIFFTEPDFKATKTFQNFLNEEWDMNLLPRRYINKALRFNGAVFIEPVKVSIAGPKDLEKYPQIIAFLNKKLRSVKLQASWGGKDKFIHVRPFFNVDGKLKALETVLKKENIYQENVATFGDSLMGNDSEILTKVKYGFTNDINFLNEHKLDVSPYILVNNESPIHAVHEAIRQIYTEN